jgi:hypothetical protein
VLDKYGGRGVRQVQCGKVMVKIRWTVGERMADKVLYLLFELNSMIVAYES